MEEQFRLTLETEKLKGAWKHLESAASRQPITGNTVVMCFFVLFLDSELVMVRRDVALAQEWRNYESLRTTSNSATTAGAKIVNNEIRLLQEWTY
ncbi:hypothetical protein AgCh_039559 [Apium graveolens]